MYTRIPQLLLPLYGYICNARMGKYVNNVLEFVFSVFSDPFCFKLKKSHATHIPPGQETVSTDPRHSLKALAADKLYYKQSDPPTCNGCRYYSQGLAEHKGETRRLNGRPGLSRGCVG